jgi:hypothetical protein
MTDTKKDVPFPEHEDFSKIIKLSNKVLTKETILLGAKEMADKIINDGVDNPLHVYIKLKALLEYCGALLENVKDGALEECRKYSKDDSTYMGVNFAVTNTGKKYDFSGDTIWSRIEDEMAMLKVRKKERETLLKTIKSGDALVDEDTGEVGTPAKVLSEGEETIKITIKNA